MSKQVTTKAVTKAPAKTAAKSANKPAAKSAPVKADVKKTPEKKGSAADALVKELTKTAPAAPVAKKPAAPAVELVSRTAAKGQSLYVISDAARPGFGKALFAHTHAALTVAGMLAPSRPAVPRNMVTTIMGQRAVNYHVAQGNFEDAADHGIRLSSAGYSTFRDRASRLDAKLANGFVGLFLDGNTGDTGIAKANVYQFKP